MAFQSGFVDNTGSLGIAHKQMLLAIKNFAESTSWWTTMRYKTDDPTSHELILRGVGLSGDQQIHVGFRTYENAAADYYNLTAAGFIGYIAGNPWASQPGMFESGVPAHNQRIDYWLAVNAQRITFGLKVGTPVYESAYAGYYLPYATPEQIDDPLCVMGMLNGAAAVRYSDTTHTMGFKGNNAGGTNRPNCRIRWKDGTWRYPEAYPWNCADIGGATNQLRDTNGQYPIKPVVLCENVPNIYGELDGIGYVSNFNNTVESTVAAGGSDWICLQDVGRTSFNDYFALRMT